MLGNSTLFSYLPPTSFLIVASIGAFLVYRVDRALVDSPEDAFNAPARVDFSHRYRWALLIVALVLTLFSAYLAPTMQVLWVEVASVVGALGLIYPLRILPGGRRPKDIAWLKTTLIVACWVGGGVVLPLIVFGGTDEIGLVAGVAAYRTVWILPNLLTADWLDRKGDQEAGSGNLVATWTIAQMRYVSVTLPALGAALATVLVWNGTPLVPVLLDLMGMIVLSWVAWKVMLASYEEDAPTGSMIAAKMVGLDLLVAWPLLAWLGLLWPNSVSLDLMSLLMCIAG